MQVAPKKPQAWLGDGAASRSIARWLFCTGLQWVRARKEDGKVCVCISGRLEWRSNRETLWSLPDKEKAQAPEEGTHCLRQAADPTFMRGGQRQMPVCPFHPGCFKTVSSSGLLLLPMLVASLATCHTFQRLFLGPGRRGIWKTSRVLLRPSCVVRRAIA